MTLVGAAARADDFELRPPQAELEIELGPRERPARVRVYWLCYERDLAMSARAWVRERLRGIDCASGPGEPAAVRAELETAAGGPVLGDPRKGDPRELDAEPGREKQLVANFCYTAANVELAVDWATRQVKARCAEVAPARDE